MPGPFDTMLDHREVVIYHAPCRWTSNTVISEIGGGYLLPVAIAAATGLLRFDWIGLASLGAALAGPTIYMVYYYIRDWVREAVVTDRRLLHRSGWHKSTITEVNLKDIGKIQVSGDCLRLTYRSGGSLSLGHPQHAGDLGMALAHAARLPAPRAVPWREKLADGLWLTCAMTTGILAAVVTLRYAYPEFTEAAASQGPIWPVVGFLMTGWILHLVGLRFGGPFSLFLLRWLFSYDQMRAWLENSEVSWPPQDVPSDADPQAEWSWRLMNLLYGRWSSPPASGGTAGNP